MADQSPSSAPLPADLPQRTAATIENWKRKLLDLSRRNRALNFKPARVSTVAIIDEQPAEVFRHLYLEEAAMRFKAAPDDGPANDAMPPDGTAPEAEPDSEALDYSEGDEALEFVPYDPMAVNERHRDDWLQTRLKADALDHSLRRIDEHARTAIEEQGVNTLFLALGMLQYRESPSSDTWFRAPLVLLPVALSRKSARSGYSIVVGDEDAIVNPALAESLRSSYGISLPELPDSETIGEAYDLQAFLKGAADAVAAQKGWQVHTDITLALFSFQKLVMFKDLEANAEAVGVHRLIRQLLARAGSPIHGLPPGIRTLDLDAAFAPESTHQVVDADSSQMRAAAAVMKGHDIVIEGPPGTGKSQTITNLVAQALAADKSVLFVAEKMAALEVVHRRLVGAGLGEFCLELHSSKGNKRAVMKELATALDASLQPVAGSAGAGKRLSDVRDSLASYVNAVHEPYGVLGKSPYFAAGELGALLQSPRIKLNTDISTVTADGLDAATRALTDLAVHARAIGQPSQHPWRDTTKVFYTEDDLDAVAASALDIEARVDTLMSDSARVADSFGLPPAGTLSEVEAMGEIADLLGGSPGVPFVILQNEAWNSPPAEATALIAKGKRLTDLRSRLDGRFRAEAFDANHAADVAYIRKKSGGLLGFLAMLDGRYRTIKRRWQSYCQANYSPTLLALADDLEQVDHGSSLTRDLAAAHGEARALFGGLWQNETTDWARLDAYVAYVVRFRALTVRRGLAANAARIAEQARPDVAPVHGLVAAAAGIRGKLCELRNAVGWPGAYLESAPMGEIGTRARALSGHIPQAPAWAAFEASRARASSTAACEAVVAAMAGEVPFDFAAAAFRRTFYMQWMSAAVQAREPLHRFDTLSHEAVVEEFRQLDTKVLRQNRAGLAGLLRDRAQHRLQQTEASASLPQLRREMAKQRRLSPLRKTLRECAGAVRAIKPCFMMSPLTVAQYLDGRTPSFDLVIFDEASQMPTEDAVGAIIRGRQLVVVGDPKQLPPTNFFSVSTGVVTAPVGDDGMPLYEDSESVLEEFMGAAVPMSRLKWHYRSAHESLIRFSNVTFYDSDLHTFPSVVTDTDGSGLQFRFVPDGIYEGKGVNLIEARRIADEVVTFARAQLARQAAGEPSLSLGVGTLNLRQQLAILDEIEIRRRAEPSIEPFFDRSIEEPFFVKNLENIQGDERDSIFLSITYGKASDGRLRYNFGPLNRENGWRRLNVLITRARRQMTVFSSIRGHDINPAGATSEGPGLLRAFLAYAEHRRLDGSSLAAAAEAESPFERDVCQELMRRGLVIQPQVGVCGYRVDLGVLDDDLPGRFVCGIECDGVSYHSMETVRDRDRLRQQVLEDRGWIIHRVWSTDWFKDRSGQIDRLMALVAEATHRVRDALRAAEQVTAQTAVRMIPEAPAARPPPAPGTYTRQVAGPYVMHGGDGIRVTANLVGSPIDVLVDAVVRVIEVEGPLHEADVIARLSGFWNTKAGSKIQAAIRDACRAAERHGRVQRREAFYWRSDGDCRVRSRAGTGISGDRIAPEEFIQAVTLVLGRGDALQRPALITETRALLGYSRTGPVLEEAIGRAIDALVVQGLLGESSGGLKLRTGL